MVLRFREELIDSSMYLKWLSLSILVGAVLVSPSARGQGGYTYSWGNSRVVDQTQIGLPNPSSTYIGSGTLSKSAQGATTSGPLVNPGLPRVNHGAYVGTPGDNLYGANPITTNSLTPEQAQARQFELQKAYILRQYQQQLQRQQQQQQAQPQGNVYVPGQNLRTGNTGMMVYPNGNGGSTATYQSTESTVDAEPNHPVARHF